MNGFQFKALPLNDDTVLEAVKYTDGNELIVPDLNCEEQAIVLMMWYGKL